MAASQPHSQGSSGKFTELLSDPKDDPALICHLRGFPETAEWTVLFPWIKAVTGGAVTGQGLGS